MNQHASPPVRWLVAAALLLAGCASAPEPMPPQQTERVPDTAVTAAAAPAVESRALLRHGEETALPQNHVVLLVTPPGLDPGRTWGALAPILFSDKPLNYPDVAAPALEAVALADPAGLTAAAERLAELIRSDLSLYSDISIVAHGSAALVARKALLLMQDRPDNLVQIRRLILVAPAVGRSDWLRDWGPAPGEAVFADLQTAWLASPLAHLPMAVLTAGRGAAASLRTALETVVPKDGREFAAVTDKNDPLIPALRTYLPQGPPPDRRPITVVVLPFFGEPGPERQEALYNGLATQAREAGLLTLIRTRIGRTPIEGEDAAAQEKAAHALALAEGGQIAVWGRRDGAGVSVIVTRVAAPPPTVPYLQIGASEDAPVPPALRLRADGYPFDALVFEETQPGDTPAIARLVMALGLKHAGDFHRALLHLREDGAELAQRYPDVVPILDGALDEARARYPVEHALLDRAIAGLDQARRQRTAAAAPEAHAAAQYALGWAYLRRSGGQDQADLEQAVAALETALAIWTPERSPYKAAHALRALGGALMLHGGVDQNTERAFAAYGQSAAVFTRSAYPYEHAAVAHDLALAYRRAALRLPAGAARNALFNNAVQSSSVAVSALPKEVYPGPLGTAYYLLGLLYADLPFGNRTDNFQRALGSYGAALATFTRTDDPVMHALIRSDLGYAYWRLPSGDVADNIRKAVATYEEALRVQRPDTLPRAHAVTQGRLGLAYAEMPAKDRGATLARAISAYQAALPVLVQLGRGAEQAEVEWHLAKAYMNLPTGDRQANLDRAIAAYARALGYYTKADHPITYAKLQAEVALAYWLAPGGARAANIRESIARQQDALTVYLKTSHPTEYAAIQNNIGIAYVELPDGDRAENLHRAIEAYKEAITIRTARDFPFEHAVTQYNIALTYWDLAELTPLAPPAAVLQEMNRHLRSFIETYADAYFAYRKKGQRVLMSTFGGDLQAGDSAVAERLYELRVRFRDLARRHPERFNRELVAQLEVGQPGLEPKAAQSTSKLK